jgi:signal peptidase II
MKQLFALALPLYAFDQATKWWVIGHIAPSHEWPPIDADAHLALIPGWFDLVHWANTGAAFSIGRDNNWFFVVLSLLTLAGLLIASARGAFADRLSRAGVGLLIAGILGNVTDRLVHHHVVDFLLVDLHVRFADPWPAFNVADSCICVAVGLFILATLREEAGKKRGDGSAPSD